MKEPRSRSKLSTNMEPVALSHPSDAGDSFSINCLLRVVRIEYSDCLLARINYCFPGMSSVSAATAMQHANRLNRLLVRAKVHVVEDIDGNIPLGQVGHHGYFLQMDSLLKGDRTQATIDAFLSEVAKDIEILLKYFQQNASKPQTKSLVDVSKGCNMASLQPLVRLVA